MLMLDDDVAAPLNEDRAAHEGAANMKRKTTAAAWVELSGERGGYRNLSVTKNKSIQEKGGLRPADYWPMDRLASMAIDSTAHAMNVEIPLFAPPWAVSRGHCRASVERPGLGTAETIRCTKFNEDIVV
jgi:hypothetical protein